MTKASLLLSLALVWSSNVFGQGANYRPEISREFLKDEPTQTQSFEILNRSIQNHAVASTLAANAGEINRNVESLMESLFYSVMDQNAKTKVSDTLIGAASYEREVQPTGIGSFVVIDRFRIGPEILKDIGAINGLPLTFRNQNKLFITNVSYRSDALRAATNQKRSGWRELANNWFGALPFLTSILPPSFNPEELYDPIGYLGTPFLFPKNAQQALAMPMGNVRSYGLNGSAGISLDFAGINPIGDNPGGAVKRAQERLSLGDLESTIPLSPYVEGEHQISILHAHDNEVWLAVTETRQVGTVLDISLGKRYRLFQAIVSWWAGSVAKIAPVDFEVDWAKVFQRDELYTFDLTKKDSVKALNKALTGDLTLAKGLSNSPTQADESGVHFQFRRLSNYGQDTSKNARSFFVVQSQKRDRINSGETVISDHDGDYVTLEAEHAVQDRDWNVLTGAQSVDVNFRFSLPVLKKVQNGETFYKLIETPEPNYFIANLKIIDAFHDTRDYRLAVNLLRRFSHLPLESLPNISIYAKDLEQRFIREQAFVNPMDSSFQRDVPPTHLGRFEAYSHVYISQETLKNIGRLEPSAFWKAYAQSFGFDSEYWAAQAESPGSAYYFNWLGSYMLMPARLFNYHTGFSDFVSEGQRLLRALQDISEATEPSEIIRAYRSMMDTTHPAQMLYTINELAPVDIPSIVGITTSASNVADDSADTKEAKQTFAHINNKKYQSSVPIPFLKKAQSAEEKLAAFTPGGYQDLTPNPQLRKVSISVRRQPPDLTPRLVASLEVSGIDSPRERLQAYFRVEENGPITLGRYVLGEQIKELDWRTQTVNGVENRQVYEVDLSGAKGLADSDYFDKALSGEGAFDLYLSVSNQEDNWGQEKKLSFDIQNGLLRDL